MSRDAVAEMEKLFRSTIDARRLEDPEGKRVSDVAAGRSRAACRPARAVPECGRGRDPPPLHYGSGGGGARPLATRTCPGRARRRVSAGLRSRAASTAASVVNTAPVPSATQPGASRAPAARQVHICVVVGGRASQSPLRALSPLNAGVQAARRGVVFPVGVASPTDATTFVTTTGGRGRRLYRAHRRVINALASSPDSIASTTRPCCSSPSSTRPRTTTTARAFRQRQLPGRIGPCGCSRALRP